MRYGSFDTKGREYVIERVDVPASWTNYLGTERMASVIAHHGGGYTWYKSPEYHRVTRFRPNGVPMDRPGHYVYLRDAEDGDYWSVSWQPVGKPLDQAEYTCRHGLSYTVYESRYKGIHASQTVFIPRGDDVLLWDVTIENTGATPRNLDVFGYVEFSYHHIAMDNQNFQMSLYATGSAYRDGAVEMELHYENNSYQFFTGDFAPDGYDCVRDTFIGLYRSETNPIAVEKGQCANSATLCYNQCGALQKHVTLMPGEKKRLLFMLGQGNADAAAKARDRYSAPGAVEEARRCLVRFWDERLSRLQVDTPNPGMNESLNLWNLYQSEINVLFSRFASFIEVGGRTGLGYRDTAQDALCIPHAEPEGCKWRISQLLQGLTSKGYGLHLFEPEWFDGSRKKEAFKSPTVVPTPDKDSIVHGLEDACADDALWLIGAITNYLRETGDMAFLWEEAGYADGSNGTVYEHMTRILEFSAEQVGQTGICKGLRADWNDCLNLGGGESAMVSMLHLWALTLFVELAREVGKEADAIHYEKMADQVKAVCRRELWDGKWFIRGITKHGKKIGTQQDLEGRVHMESNTWAVISGAADREQALSAMDSVDESLYTAYGLMLNAPSFTKPDDDIGFIGRVYPGVKENGSIFSHPNPWAWVAESMLGRGDRAMKFYDALLPYNQNDQIEVRYSEPYSYCQFIMGEQSPSFGRANHPWMTGSAGWAYFAATQYMLGIRPGYQMLTIDPCIPSHWNGFAARRVWRGATYNIRVENLSHVQKGVQAIFINGQKTDSIPAMKAGTVCEVRVVMG